MKQRHLPAAFIYRIYLPEVEAEASLIFEHYRKRYEPFVTVFYIQLQMALFINLTAAFIYRRQRQVQITLRYTLTIQFDAFNIPGGIGGFKLFGV